MKRLHFVVPAQFAEETAALPDQTVGEDYPYWLGGRFNWVAQSYLILRKYCDGLTIGASIVNGVPNFAHCMVWRQLGARQGEYRISVRADYPRLFDVDFEVLQNPASRMGSRQAYLPYWPVPGMIRRDPRRNRIARIAFAGRIGPKNITTELLQDNTLFNDLQFAVIPSPEWHDMSQVDLLIAIRDFSGAKHDDKPPSKLFNAWRADIPMIGGLDSAFSSVGQPGIDYVRVADMREFEQAIGQLRNDPEYYNSLVTEGRKRVPEISTDAIAKKWLRILGGAVSADYNQWKDLGRENARPIFPALLDGARKTASNAKGSFKAVFS